MSKGSCFLLWILEQWLKRGPLPWAARRLLLKHFRHGLHYMVYFCKEVTYMFKNYFPLIISCPRWPWTELFSAKLTNKGGLWWHCWKISVCHQRALPGAASSRQKPRSGCSLPGRSEEGAASPPPACPRGWQVGSLRGCHGWGHSAVCH